MVQFGEINLISALSEIEPIVHLNWCEGPIYLYGLGLFVVNNVS